MFSRSCLALVLGLAAAWAQPTTSQSPASPQPANWEGTGLEPDVKVPATDALATAQKLAAEKLGSK